MGLEERHWDDTCSESTNAAAHAATFRFVDAAVARGNARGGIEKPGPHARTLRDAQSMHNGYRVITEHGNHLNAELEDCSVAQLRRRSLAPFHAIETAASYSTHRGAYHPIATRLREILLGPAQGGGSATMAARAADDHLVAQ